MSNLDLWESVEQTDPSFVKWQSIGGQQRACVDAQHKKKLITKALGPYGIKWGVYPESEKFTSKKHANDTEIMTYTATAFYHYEGEVGKFGIAASIKEAYVTKNGQGYLKIDDEAIKKVRTDALTKGFTDLGFCSDIHMGLFEDQNYVEGARAAAEIEKSDKRDEAVSKAISEIKSWFDCQVESARTISNNESFEKVINRIGEQVANRCKAAGVNPQNLFNKLDILKGERNGN